MFTTGIFYGILMLMSATPAYRTARELSRDHLTSAILDAARIRVAADGAAALSLRAVARDLGMASSAVYRYFASRDALITALIINAYDAVGAVAESTNSQTRAAGTAPADRFAAVWRSIRAWALTHPHEYALIFGSPVPGYAAPADTIGPATRVPAVLLEILGELQRELPPHPTDSRTPHAEKLAHALAPLRDFAGGSRFTDATLLQAITSWETLFGAISFEIFGHTHNVIASETNLRDAFFDAQIELVLSTFD